jgi:flagellar motor switch protein FliN/FliY
MSQAAVNPADSGVAVHPPDFPPLSQGAGTGATLPLQRFFDVSVTVSVELGRVTLPLGQLLQLGEGAVVELDRYIAQPVDLMAQGVRLARGEVVVVEDRYAVRITQVEQPSNRATA